MRWTFVTFRALITALASIRRWASASPLVFRHQLSLKLCFCFSVQIESYILFYFLFDHCAISHLSNRLSWLYLHYPRSKCLPVQPQNFNPRASTLLAYINSLGLRWPYAELLAVFQERRVSGVLRILWKFFILPPISYTCLSLSSAGAPDLMIIASQLLFRFMKLRGWRTRRNITVLKKESLNDAKCVGRGEES